MSTSTAYNWLKQISPTVMQWDQVPLYGAGPAFPWEEISAKLAQLFQLQSIRIVNKETDWRNPNELKSGFGGEPFILPIGMANIESPLFWVMGKNDLAALMELLLNRSPDDFVALDSDFFLGFYRFLAAQTFNTLSQFEFGKNLNPGVLESAPLPSEDSLCLEIDIAIRTTDKEKLAKGRLIIPPEALTAWRQRWADRSLETALHSPLAEKLQVEVHLEVGRTSLSQSEWSAIIPGDFLILDQCSYDLEAAKGRVMMTVNSVPMFRAKLKQGNIKILEFPMYHEASMNNNENASDDLGEFEDEEFEEEEHTELEETEESTVEEEASEELEEEEEAPPKPAPAVKLAEGPRDKIMAGDIPLNIVIEVGRLQMSIQKLMELEPGNTLELDIHPENGVDLVVNGRRIGKGELLRLGENLGVRILDIG